MKNIKHIILCPENLRMRNPSLIVRTDIWNNVREKVRNKSILQIFIHLRVKLYEKS